MGEVLRGDRGDGDADPGHTIKCTIRYASELAERSRAGELLSEAENGLLAELENIDRDIRIQLQPALDELNGLGQGVHEAIEQNPLLNNLFAGLDSPDPRQRARFRAAMDEHLGELNLVEHASILRVLERAKKRRGRKVGSKRCTGDAAAHQKMRHLKASNPTMSKTKAAQIAAKEVPQGRAQAKSVEKRIARTYPWGWDVK